jgi:peptidoglycan-associated lipoprotein
MMNLQLRSLPLVAALAGVFLLAGCNKKIARVTPPPPPPPAAPTASLAANPNVIQQGQSTTLTWQTQNANEIMIQGIGAVPASGTRRVTPNVSTTYMLTAKGPGGTQDATTRVTVNSASAAKAVPSSVQPSEESLFGKSVKDVFFDFNKANIRPDEVSVTDNDGSFLTQHPDIKILIEGHCDDRGSEVYNLALGDSRANSLKSSLEEQGINGDRINTISYGKEKPFCTADNEECWQLNRRDHVVFER